MGGQVGLSLTPANNHMNTPPAETAETAAKAAAAAKRKASKLSAAALACGCPPECACHEVGDHRRGDDVQNIAASRAKQPYGLGKPPPGKRCYRCANKNSAKSEKSHYKSVKPPRLSAVFFSPGGHDPAIAETHAAAPRSTTTT